jgi:hypothetical protein
MILTATGRAGGGGGCWRTIHCPRLAHLDTRLLRGRSRDGRFSSPPAEEPDQSGNDHDHGTAYGRHRRGGRPAEGGPQRRLPADRGHAESIKIGCLQRVSIASIRHVVAESATVEGVDARTQPSGGLATRGQAEETGDVLAHDPLWTTVDVATFLMYGPTAAKQFLQIAAVERGGGG